MRAAHAAMACAALVSGCSSWPGRVEIEIAAQGPDLLYPLLRWRGFDRPYLVAWRGKDTWRASLALQRPGELHLLDSRGRYTVEEARGLSESRVLRHSLVVVAGRATTTGGGRLRLDVLDVVDGEAWIGVSVASPVPYSRVPNGRRSTWASGRLAAGWTPGGAYADATGRVAAPWRVGYRRGWWAVSLLGDVSGGRVRAGARLELGSFHASVLGGSGSIEGSGGVRWMW